MVKHTINTGDHKPIKQRPRRLPLAKREAEREEVDKMLQAGVIEPSSSPWASPIVLVTKKDGSIRYCIDYRQLNNITLKDSYPLPHPQDCLESLRESKWFSTLDLQSGYWQVEVDPKDKEKTAFTSMSGLFQFCVMPFGLTNAPSTFERLMDKVFKGLNPEICLLYLDDIIVKSATFEDHIQNLRVIFDRLKNAGLKLSPKKCHLFKEKVTFLGHVVSKEGISTDPEKIDAVLNWPVPKTLTELRSFLGLCSYYRKFIKGFASLAKPLHHLTEKDVKFEWNCDCQNAFTKLKNLLTQAPVLSYPEPSSSFILDTDVSGVGLGAVLSQVQGSHEKVIGYYSRTLSKSERRYCVTRRELLAVVDSIKHFHPYLWGIPFLVRSDHGSLRWFLNFRNLEGQLGRWNEILGSYNFTLVHRSGKLHNNADSLSRRPCNRCDFCEKIERKSTEEEVGIQCECRQVKDQSSIVNWIEGKTSDDISQAQDQDPGIAVIKKWKMSSETRPRWKHISHQGRIVKAYWSQWDRLVIVDNVLYRLWWEQGKKQPMYQLVLPQSLRDLALSQLHNQATSGHMGIKRTIARVRRRYYWTGYKTDICDWCSKCEVCQKRKSPLRKHKGPMHQYVVGVPFERIALDITGPLPETEQGNKYVLVLSNYFTRWVEAFPIRDIEAKTVADVMLQGFFSRYGVPKQIHSDQGTQFESKLFQELCRVFGIEKTRTTPYHPQSDGLVERFNRTLGDMLSKLVNISHRNWDEVLPYVMMAYRSSVHESTGQSPSSMHFGHEIQLPIDLLLGEPPKEVSSSISSSSYVVELKDVLSRIHDLAREKMIEASDRQKRSYDLRKNFKSYSIGDSVFLFDPARRKGTSSKLHSPWSGPFLVVSKVTDLIYKIQKHPKAVKKCVHHDRLKPSFIQLDSWLEVHDSCENIAPQEDVIEEDGSASSNETFISDKTDRDHSGLYKDETDLPNDVNDIPGNEQEIDSFSGKTENPNQNSGSFSGKTETPKPDELVSQTTRFGRKTRPPKYLEDFQLKICFSDDI